MESEPQLTAIVNFRDVGRVINRNLGKRIMKEGILFRSAKPDSATFEDRNILTETYGIRLILDLRTTTELQAGVNDRKALLEDPAAIKANPALTGPVRIPGVRYTDVKLIGSAFKRYLIKQLSWCNIFLLLIYELFGFKQKAVQLVGNKVMNPRGLVGMGLIMLDLSGQELCMGLRHLITDANLPVLVHCTQGKDRSGLLVAVALMAIGVPIAAIDEDYQLTDKDATAEDKAERLEQVRSAGLDDEWSKTDPNLIRRMHEHMNEQYGGVASYLDSIGFTEVDRVALKKVLLY